MKTIDSNPNLCPKLALALLFSVVLVTGCGQSSTTEEAASTAPEPAEDAGGGDEAPTLTMKDALGEEHTLTMRYLPDSRDYIYCEMVFNYGDKGSDIYTTSHLEPCDTDWWDNLDLEAVAAERGAESATKNGPQWWSMDEVDQAGAEPVSVAGVDMTFGAHLPPGTLGTANYGVFYPAKNQNLTWTAGKKSYQLVDTDGNVYVVQGHKIPTDELDALGDRMKDLPEGWEYRVVDLKEDLVMNLTPAQAIPSVSDEFNQIYIRIPEN